MAVGGTGTDTNASNKHASCLQQAQRALQAGQYRQAQTAVAQAESYASLPGGAEIDCRAIWQEFLALLASADRRGIERILHYPRLQHPESAILLTYLRFYYQHWQVNQEFRAGKYLQAIKLAQNYSGPSPLRQLMQNQAHRLLVRIQEHQLEKLIGDNNFAEATQLFSQLRLQLSPRQIDSYQRQLQHQQTLVSYQQAIKDNHYLRAMQIAHTFSSSSWRQRFAFAKSLLIKDLRLIKIVAPADGAVLGSRIIEVTGVVPHSYYRNKLKINGISPGSKDKDWLARIVANEGRAVLALTYHPWNGKTIPLEKTSCSDRPDSSPNNHS